MAKGRRKMRKICKKCKKNEGNEKCKWGKGQKKAEDLVLLFTFGKPLKLFFGSTKMEI